MSIIDKSQIQSGVLNMLKVNMGVMPGEKILVKDHGRIRME